MKIIPGGDVTKPEKTSRPRVIAHCCNDLGVMGAGVAASIRAKWPKAYRDYKDAIVRGSSGLGDVVMVEVEEDLFVANIIGQRGVGPNAEGVPPIRYEALEHGLMTVAEFCRDRKATLHIPKLGSGLAGGRWETIQGLLEKTCAGIDITLYDFDAGPHEVLWAWGF